MKINIGRQSSGKKYIHKLPSAVTTTSQFGFLQPFYCRESAAQDTYSIRNAAMVRLQPVVKPTFGRLFLKEYTSFIPMEEIWHPWGSFLKGETFSGAISSYIPSLVPSCSLGFLSIIQLCMSEVTMFVCRSGSTINHIEEPVWFDGSGTVTPLAIMQDWLNSISVSVGSNLSDIATFAYNNRMLYFKTSFNEDLEESPDLIKHHGRFDYFAFHIFNGSSYALCFRLSNRGKNFLKVMVGLGYQFMISVDSKSILPFVAYYKMYFDLFAPQRFITWKETIAYNIMEYMEQSSYNVDYLMTDSTWRTKLLSFFMKDIPEAYYTQDSDFAAAHIDGAAVSSVPSSRDFLKNNNTEGTIYQQSIDTSPQHQGTSLTQNALDILKRLYHRVNINTAVGGKIKEYMQAIFGSAYDQDDEMNFIGAQTVDIDISDVMSTAETSEGYLGEYAGKGIGYDAAGKPFKYTCAKAGYVISMFAIIPDARLCQQIDPNLSHLEREDFFQSAFDATTLLPTRKMSIFGVRDTANYIQGFESGFGNIPNYTEYKISFDKLNGELVQRSTREALLPFSMSKYILPSSTTVGGQEGKELFIDEPSSSVITNGLRWRYIGLDNWLGNFNRIFVNSGNYDWDPDNSSEDELDYPESRLDDNFVVYLYCDVTVTGYELPLADSFQTDSFGDHLSVQKQ